MALYLECDEKSLSDLKEAIQQGMKFLASENANRMCCVVLDRYGRLINASIGAVFGRGEEIILLKYNKRGEVKYRHPIFNSDLLKVVQEEFDQFSS